MPTVSAIIPTYQRRDSLGAVMTPLLADPALHELIVAVDGSTDGTLEFVEAQRQRDARVVVVPLANRGIACARQAGLEAAGGEVALFIDDDVVAAPGLVSGHARRHAGAEGLLVKGYTPNEWRHLPPGRRAIARIYRSAYEQACARYEREPDHVLLGFWGGNFSVRRTDGLRIGIANPVFGRGAREEDREFGIRCFQDGLRGVFDRSLLADHRYDRGVEAFRRDCRESGRYRHVIHALHPSVVGTGLNDGTADANTADRPGQGLPRPLRRLLPVLASGPMFHILSGTLAAVFRAASAVGALGIETVAARGLGSLETQRGVLDRTPVVRVGPPTAVRRGARSRIGE